MDRYYDLLKKAPIICVGDKTVHMSSFIADIMHNESEHFNKERALEDLEVVIDYINQLEKDLEKELEKLGEWKVEKL